MYQPFFWGDYLRDTGQLSLLEHGVYLRLIGEYWNTGKPFADPARMMRALQAHTDEEKQAIQHVLEQYFHFEEGVWRHHRIERSLKEHTERAEAASDAAKRAAEARWDAERMRGALPSASETHCVSDANHSTPTHNQTIATPLHSTSNPIQSNIKDLGVGKGGLGETHSGGSGSFKNKEGGGWDVIHFISPRLIEEARHKAQGAGWDFYALVNKYNEWVKIQGKPKNPERAFPVWMANFLKDRKANQ